MRDELSGMQYLVRPCLLNGLMTACSVAMAKEAMLCHLNARYAHCLSIAALYIQLLYPYSGLDGMSAISIYFGEVHTFLGSSVVS